MHNSNTAQRAHSSKPVVAVGAFLVVAVVGVLFFSGEKVTQPSGAPPTNTTSGVPISFTLPEGWTRRQAFYPENSVPGGGPMQALHLLPPGGESEVSVDFFSYSFRPDVTLAELPDLLVDRYVPGRELVTRENVTFADRAAVRIVTEAGPGAPEGEPYRISIYLARISVKEVVEIDITYPAEASLQNYRGIIADMLDTLVITDS
ncbi:MAG: hypothetical protein HY566_03770 [Candidatus Kerfeldbacteria bacterium]|nr:hypothetical protein [Candidatus Kerfeldbacteria bacterium]